MFGLFTNKKDKIDSLNEVEEHLKIMGYDLLSYGVVVAKLEIVSGYNPVETASHIAFTTMALDIKEAGESIVSLMAFLPHRQALLKILKEYKDNKMMNPTQWENDANAIQHITTVDEHQLEWIDRILGDPVAGKERLAKSRIEYSGN